MLKKMGLRCAAAMGIAAMAITPAHAAVNCNGTVSNSIVYADGRVIVLGSWAPSYTQICNIKVAWKGITPDVCIAWLAKIDAAVSLNNPMIIRYEGSGVACGTLPSYSSTPAPAYVMLV